VKIPYSYPDIYLPILFDVRAGQIQIRYSTDFSIKKKPKTAYSATRSFSQPRVIGSFIYLFVFSRRLPSTNNRACSGHEHQHQQQAAGCGQHHNDESQSPYIQCPRVQSCMDLHCSLSISLLMFALHRCPVCRPSSFQQFVSRRRVNFLFSA